MFIAITNLSVVAPEERHVSDRERQVALRWSASLQRV
jgi:hypothetical protein